MTPQEAQHRIKTYGTQAYVSPIYRQMTPTELQALVDECDKPNPEDRLDRVPVPRLAYNPLDRLLGRPAAPTGQAPDQATAQVTAQVTETSSSGTLPPSLEKALGNPKRLRTPPRQRTAFLAQLERCGAVAEAAARARVNRGTLYRWRAEDPAFARRWVEAIQRHTDAVADDIALQAGKVEIQPIFYRGTKIGERRRINTRLLIHVQNRLDAERRRAEDRAERRELFALRATLAQQSPEKRHSATPHPTADYPLMCAADLGLPDPA